MSIISASILSADFARLGEEVDAVLHAGVQQIHFDVMDFHYVPNLSFGAVVCNSLRQYGIKAPIDVHLMVENPDLYIEPFAKAGANSLTIHAETTPDVHHTLQTIHKHGMQAGLAFNPKQPLQIEEKLWPLLNLILMMTVEPGFGGQGFLPGSLEKIAKARQWVNEKKLNVQLGVDGGINVATIGEVAKAGADFFVVGSGLFHAPNYLERVQDLRKQIV
jgi:ribulose-phosphate 3-epimerase